MSFPRYPMYKDSRVEWLGDVPDHWNVPPLYLRYEAVLGKMLDEKRLTRRYLLPYLRNVDVQWDCVNVDELPELDIAPDELERFTLKCGDLLICEGGEVGRTAIWRGEMEQCAFQKAIHRLRPLSDNENARFFYHCMCFAASTGVFLAEGNPNTIPHLTGEKLRRYRFPTPPIAEQTSIANFLDRETSKIDELVSEQHRLIELLKEKRQAVISQAVTKGLNPDAPMKPSGIEWLGDVPEHWNTRTIAKASTKITNGYVGPTRDILVEDGTPYIQATHIKKGRVNFDEGYFVTAEWSRSHSKSILAEGDVLIVQTGAGTGDIGLVTTGEIGFNCHALIIVASRPEILTGEFLAFVLQSEFGRQKLESIQTGGMHPHLNCGNVKYVEIPLPSKNEQAAIVNHIHQMSSRIDSLISEAQRAIDMLRERRTALISAAVTGKIDVRGLVKTGAA